MVLINWRNQNMNTRTAITKQQDPQALAVMNDLMTQAGQAANEAGARHAFEDHTARKANNTIRRKIADLALFETFLQSAGVPVTGLYDNPQAKEAAAMQPKQKELEHVIALLEDTEKRRRKSHAQPGK
jgi:hypothetical protein